MQSKHTDQDLPASYWFDELGWMSHLYSLRDKCLNADGVTCNKGTDIKVSSRCDQVTDGKTAPHIVLVKQNHYSGITLISSHPNREINATHHIEWKRRRSWILKILHATALTGVDLGLKFSDIRKFEFLAVPYWLIRVTVPDCS